MFILSRLADWSSGAGPHGQSANDMAVLAIEDFFACLVAGSAEPAATAAMRGVARWRGGVSHMLGAGLATAPVASLVNATSAHALDFDDLYIDAANHPSAVILPALIALGEEMGSSGAEVLDAYIVGLELNHWLAVGVMNSHSEIGWHTTSTIGAIAAAGGCARLMALDRKQTAHAMSIGVSMAGGTKIQFGSLVKPLHAGLAAHHGVQAAALAAGGVEGRLDALEGALGFGQLLGGPHAPGWGNLQGLGEQLRVVERPGLAFKRFPCCGATHRALDVLLDLHSSERLDFQSVRRIDVTVGLHNYRNLRYPEPMNIDEAKFSMQYCAAVALELGRVTLGDFTPAAIVRPEIRRWFPLIHLHHHQPNAEGAAGARPHIVDIAFTDGRQLRRERALPKGTVADPFSEADREAKFMTCAGLRLREGTARRIRSEIAKFETIASIAELMSTLHSEISRAPTLRTTVELP